jgi:hypothetical protein
MPCPLARWAAFRRPSRAGISTSCAAGVARRLEVRLKRGPGFVPIGLGSGRGVSETGRGRHIDQKRTGGPLSALSGYHTGHPAGSSGGPRRLTRRRFPDPIRNRVALSQHFPAAEMPSGAVLPAMGQQRTHAVQHLRREPEAEASHHRIAGLPETEPTHSVPYPQGTDGMDAAAAPPNLDPVY